ncbi:Isoquinoline 1-oxidoreductase subunit [Hyphococcus sp.]|uniref:Isoquinoline 1-oxidoreductase subunit n=1 Tax=Hyphococcus sp. TaxID=2038636 RepID=UPI003CCB8C08
MRNRQVLLSTVFAAACGLAACGQNNDDAGSASRTGALEVNGLQTPAAFADIADTQERAAALFTEMAKVIQHPRCANCHPKSGGPTQGDDMHPHNPPVVRGEAGLGATGMECTTCHGEANVEFASMEGSIPGASPWHLPPESMGWQNSTPSEICAQIKDPERNGGKSLEDIVKHNGEDHLVNWAWNPGEGRTPAPGDQETFGALTAAWVEAGAACPG